MGLWVWLLFVGLAFGSGFNRAGDSVLVRHQRQSDAWWRNYQPSASEWGSPRQYPPSGQSWRHFVSYDDRSSQSRQLQPQQSSPVNVLCGEAKMVVTVRRDLYGNGKLVKVSDLSLGPQSCVAGPQSTATSVVFNISLQECGNKLQTTPDWLVYTTQVSYHPKTTIGVPITRTNPAVIPIQCYYPRHGNVSSKPIKPTWMPFSTTVSSEERLSFSLRLMTDDWSAPRPSAVFQLGNMFSIEAAVDTQNHVPMMVFVDSCVATLTPDVTSNPRYDIISFNGCLVDGKQEDSSSAFRSPRTQPDKLQFMVDAFRFIETDVSTIYITCSLKAAAITQVPDPLNKACSYKKPPNSWSPVEGSNAICQCCDTGSCAGQSRRLESLYGRPRGLGKREITADPSTEEHGQATLGPLLVVGAKHVRASTLKSETGQWKLWMLVTIVSVSLVVTIGGIVLAVKCVLKRRAHVLIVDK